MIGTTLSHFKITAKLGAGGMGEVYKAEDTKLGREVAIKVLPEVVASDPERLARFEREAKVLASLNHPNISGIYSLESAVGEGLAPSREGTSPSPTEGNIRVGEPRTVNFLVMELAEGEDLSKYIAQGPMSLERSLAIARQIAEALEAAHEKGIVHRDLKPANIKIGSDAQVKVLDFGLAKALDPAASDAGEGLPGSSPARISLSPTLTAQMTQPGVLLGTAAYMSPEQARGQEADKRADIWAFGVVLMEMLTGRLVYAGDTVSDTLAGILAREPEWEELPKDTPRSVRQVLDRCLEKDAAVRLRDIGEARIAIDRFLADPDADAATKAMEESTQPTPLYKNPLAWLAAALAIALLFSLWLGRGPQGEPESAEALRFSVAPLLGTNLLAFELTSVDISSDGSRIVLIATDEAGTRNLYVKKMNDLEIRQVPNTEDARGPFLSPDGEWVGFFTSSELRTVKIDGGAPQVLAQVTNTRGGDWSEDGTIIYTDSTASGLMRIAERGGVPEPLTTLDEERLERTHRFPHVLPGGRAVLFTSDTFETTEYYDDARIEAVSVEDGRRVVVLEESSTARYLGTGDLLYARAGSIFSIPFDLDTLETSGTASLALQSVSTDIASGAVQFAVSAGGDLVYVSGEAQTAKNTLSWLQDDGSIEPAGLDPGNHFSISLSPDDSRLSIISAMGPSTDVWVFDIERAAMSRLTFEGAAAVSTWTPDGKRVAFGSSRDGVHTRVYWKPADGSGQDELIFESDFPAFPGSFSPDGKNLAVHVLVPDRGADILIKPLDGDQEAYPFAESRFIEWQPAFSPDGRWLAYTSDESGIYQIYVRAFPGPGGKWQISTQAGLDPIWSRDGRALYFRAASRLMKAAIDTTDGFKIGAVEELSNELMGRAEGGGFDVTSDGRVLFLGSPREDEKRGEVSVVLNWAAEVEAQ